MRTKGSGPDMALRNITQQTIITIQVENILRTVLFLFISLVSKLSNPDMSHQGSADRPYNNEIVIISPNEAKSLSKGLLNLGNITKVVSNRGKAKM